MLGTLLRGSARGGPVAAALRRGAEAPALFADLSRVRTPQTSPSRPKRRMWSPSCRVRATPAGCRSKPYSAPQTSCPALAKSNSEMDGLRFC